MVEPTFGLSGIILKVESVNISPLLLMIFFDSIVGFSLTFCIFVVNITPVSISVLF